MELWIGANHLYDHEVFAMSRILIKFAVCLFLSLITANAQPVFNQPESVTFDTERDRYLVSNTADGSIVAMDTTGALTLINDDQTSCRGIHLDGALLYAACDAGVAVINVVSGETQATFAVPGAVFLNDVVADTTGSIYVSDSAGGAIYRVDAATGAVSGFVTAGLANPNGLLLDPENNRLLVCSFRDNTPIQAISLADSSVSVVVETTLSNLDGLARDADGRIYASSWATNSVYRFNADFSGQPEVFSDGHAGPADISFSEEEGVLAVPNFNGNTIDFLDVPALTASEDALPPQESRLLVFPPYPNPASRVVTMSYELSKATDVRVTVYDLAGRAREEILAGRQTAGEHAVRWDTDGYAAGVYFYMIDACDTSHVGKMMVVR